MKKTNRKFYVGWPACIVIALGELIILRQFLIGSAYEEDYYLAILPLWSVFGFKYVALALTTAFSYQAKAFYKTLYICLAADILFFIALMTVWGWLGLGLYSGVTLNYVLVAISVFGVVVLYKGLEAYKSSPRSRVG